MYSIHPLDRPRAVKSVREDSVIDADGVITWKKSGNVLPEEYVALALELGLAVNIEKTNAARDAHLDDFLKRYRKARAERSPEQIAEERAEARAAHGPGVELVNVITGEKYRT